MQFDNASQVWLNLCWVQWNFRVILEGKLLGLCYWYCNLQWFNDLFTILSHWSPQIRDRWHWIAGNLCYKLQSNGQSTIWKYYKKNMAQGAHFALLQITHNRLYIFVVTFKYFHAWTPETWVYKIEQNIYIYNITANIYFSEHWNYSWQISNILWYDECYFYSIIYFG